MNEKYFRICGVLLLFCICGISSAGALSATYVGIDKVDLQWWEPYGYDFESYTVYRGDTAIATIYSKNDVRLRDDGLVPGQTYDYRVRTVTESGSDDQTCSVTVGKPRGTLTMGDDTWTRPFLTMDGNVDLNGHSLNISGCTIDAASERKISGSGELGISDADLTNITVSVTAPGALIENVRSDRPITVRGGTIAATNVAVPRDSNWVGGDLVLYLYGDGNTISSCNAEVRLQGDWGVIEDCIGEYTRIRATGNNLTIRNNTIRDVPGYGIYVSGNDLMIRYNDIRNATRWEKSYYVTEEGTGIRLYECYRNVDLFENTIAEAGDKAIHATGGYASVMEDWTVDYNTIRDCKYGIFAQLPSQRWTVGENTVTDCLYDGIYLQSTNWSKVSGNTLTGCRNGGIYFAGGDAEISENTVTLYDGEGISAGTQQGMGNLTVAGNIVTGLYTEDGCPEGIYFSGQDGMLRDNAVYDCKNGMYAGDRENQTILNNEVLDCWGEWGLYAYELYGGRIEGNTFENITGTSDGGAIYVHRTGNATVCDNRIEGGRRGINVVSADDGLVIRNNTVRNATSTCIRVNAAKNGDPYKKNRGPANVVIQENIAENGFYGFALSDVDGVTVAQNRVEGCSSGIMIERCNGTVVSENLCENVETGFRVYAASIYDSVISGNVFNVSETGIRINKGTKNTTVADNVISGYDICGIQVNDPEKNRVVSNTLTASSPGAWDIILSIPEGVLQETLLLEKNTLGKSHPTTVTITDPNEPIFIRGVENPPEPPSYPDYQTTKQEIGNWVEIYGELGKTDVQLNLTFHYTKENLGEVNASTLQIWKHNGTRWDAGSADGDSWNGTRWHDLDNREIGVEVEELCIFAPLGGQTVHNLRIPKDYSTIDEALRDYEFQDGDTITVDGGYSGTKENLAIFNEVTLKSASGLPADVVLTASDPYKPVVTVYSDDVEIDGFVLTGATGSQGLRVEGAETVKLKNSRVEGNYFGVTIRSEEDYFHEPSSHCTIQHCTVTGNEHGAVYINRSNDCNVFDCTLSGAVGIGIEDGTGNYLADNTLTDCADYGIVVDGGGKNRVTGNTLSGGTLGIYLFDSDENTVERNTVTATTDSGLLLEKAEENAVGENTVEGSPLGIVLKEADENTLTANRVDGGAGGSRLVGIVLEDSDENTVTRCSVKDLAAIGYAVTGLEVSGSSSGNTVDTCSFSGFEAARVDGADIGASGNLIRNSTFTDLRGGPAGVSGVIVRQNTAGTVLRKCTIDGLYAPENATGVSLTGATGTRIVDSAIGSVLPENTSSYVVFERSAYSNSVEATTLGPLAAITSLYAAGNVTASNATAVPPDGEDTMNIGHYLNLTSDGTGEVSVAFTYTDEDLDGRNPALLAVWRHDGSAWSKVPAPNGVNTAGRYVYAENITEFSIFAPIWSASGMPRANFTAEPTDGDAPLAVQFTDASRNAESWSWTFGDGAASTGQNPIHTYTAIGRFDVTLTVGNAIGTDTLTRTHYITVRDVPPEPPERAENFTLRDNGTSVTAVGGKQQVSFNATTGNGTVSGDEIVLTGGNMNVTIRTDGLTTAGNVSVGNVTGVLLESSPVSTDLGDLGNVSVNFNASMNGYNPDLGITTAIYDRPSDEAATSFTLAAADDGLSVTSTAYAVYFTKTNLTENDTIRDAVLRMTVAPDWVNANGGTDAIRIFRQGDDGDTEALATTYLGIDADGMMVFEAVSPRGFSAFAVIAAKAVVTPAPTPSPASGGGGSSVKPTTVVGSASLLTASWGGVLRPYLVSADEGFACLAIDTGVIALDVDGEPLPEVGIAVVSTLPSDPSYTFSGYAVDCTPDGSAFSPAIDLIFTFTTEEWAGLLATADGDAGRLVVQGYNATRGVWEDCPTSVDAAARTVTASISHFSTYALTCAAEATTPVTPEQTVTVPATAAPQTPPAGEGAETLSFLYIAVALVAVLVVAGVAFVLMGKRR
ncbi:right-handed parallel beta-helix repeat-containing protein [Methanoculleus frigidifontis]|nr:right-handed parallel beta-helix repeat-containing protein [Methanoculleus sp. FWC-SCC1]